jgi:hypothetical protein
MTAFLSARQIRIFDYPRFAKPPRLRVRDRDPIPPGSVDGDGSPYLHTCRSLHPSGMAQLGSGTLLHVPSMCRVRAAPSVMVRHEQIGAEVDMQLGHYLFSFRQ